MNDQQNELSLFMSGAFKGKSVLVMFKQDYFLGLRVYPVLIYPFLSYGLPQSGCVVA